MKNTTVKKSVILVVVLALSLMLVLAACAPKAFTPVQLPEQGTVEGNGGVAVKYGEWLYYINGYTSDVNAENTYTDVTNAPRVGSVVRIKLAEIENLFAIQEKDNLLSSEKTEQIDAYLRGQHEDYTEKHGAETVVPKIYYSGNTTSTQFTGLYIFGDRLYITTPNDELTAGGSQQTNQLVLTSYKLDGSDEQRHFVFTDNSVQLCLTEKEGKVIGTYIMNSKLYTLDVAAKSSTEVTVNGTDKAEKAESAFSNPTWDMAGKCVFFIDKTLSICKLDFGNDKYDVIVENPDVKVETHEGEDHSHVTSENATYTINSVNNGEVYYTVAYSKNPSASNVQLFWANSEKQGEVAFNSTTQSNLRGWKEGKIIYTETTTTDSGSYYGINVITDKEGSKTPLLIPAYNNSSITIDRLEGDTLYYTANSVKYTLDLVEWQSQRRNGTAYAYNLGSAAGWAIPDFVDNGDIHYIITPSTSGALTVAKFDPANPKKEQASVSLVLKAAPQD